MDKEYDLSAGEEENKGEEDHPLLSYLLRGNPTTYMPLPASAIHKIEFDAPIDKEAANTKALSATCSAVDSLLVMLEELASTAPGEKVNLSAYVGRYLEEILGAVNEAMLSIVPLRNDISSMDEVRERFCRKQILAAAAAKLSADHDLS